MRSEGRRHPERQSGAGHGRADLQGLADVLDPGRQGSGKPAQDGAAPLLGDRARGWPRGRRLVEQGGREGQRAHAVGEGVVELEEHREGVRIGPGQYVRLPRGQRPVQRPGHQRSGRGVRNDLVGTDEEHVPGRVEAGVR